MPNIEVKTIYAREDKFTVNPEGPAPTDQSYAFLELKNGAMKFVMRIAIHGNQIVWRDRDGNTDKVLEFVRADQEPSDGTVLVKTLPEIHIQDKVSVNQVVKGTVRRIITFK